MQRLLPLLLAVLGPVAVPTARADDFLPLGAEVRDRAVVMSLPQGVRRVRLRVLDAGEWRIHTIAHLEGSEGFLKLRLPDGVEVDDLEVAASWSDPHPYSFYQGASEFAALPADDGTRLTPDVPMAGGGGEDGADPAGEPVTVEESDIWKWRGDTLYYFNQYRGLQVVDVADVANPRLVASLRVPAAGEQMYLLPGQPYAALLTHDPLSGDGRVLLVRHDGAGLTPAEPIPVNGWIIESRLVGDTLYVVSRLGWEERFIDADGITHVTWKSGLEVSRIGLADPASPVVDEPLRLVDDSYSYWGAQVQATPQALLIATNRYDSLLRQSVSTVHVVDIGDPSTPLAVGHRVAAAGQVMDKFNLHAEDGVLAVVSQVWRGIQRTRYACVETFDLSGAADGGSAPRLGRLEFASNETITATRFVGDRVYVVTVLQIDPLFVVSLADPARPRLLGELEVPGFSTHLEPFGDDALISVGVEGNRIAVSWFDVADPATPQLASRVYVGADKGWSWTEANYDEKALGFFPDERLLLLPYQGSDESGNWTGGMQLIELGERELLLRGGFTHEFQARRGRVLGEAVASVSSRTLKTLDIADRDAPRLLAELPLAWPADLVARVGGHLVQVERGGGWWWNGAQPDGAALRVSPADDSDRLVGGVDLGLGQVVGLLAEPARSLVWVAQVRQPDPAASDPAASAGVFTILAVDLADPATPVIAGRDSVEVPVSSRYGWYYQAPGYQGTWLPGGEQVWFPTASGGHGWIYADPLLDGPVGAPVPDFWYPYAPTTGAVYTVDPARPDDPMILAAIDPSAGGKEDSWREGDFHLRGEVLYYGLQRTAAETDDDGTTRWMSSHWLGRIDLGNPAEPALRDPVSIPGTLEQVIGERRDDSILVTSTSEWLPDPLGQWHYELRLQGLAFDGVDAFLVDELVLDDMGSGPRAFDGADIVLGESIYEEAGATTRLLVFRWATEGRFERVNSLKRTGSAYQLAIRDRLLLALGSKGIEVSEFADPAEPSPTVLGFQGIRFWGQLDEIAIHQRGVAYVPSGLYGVEVLDFGDAFADPRPAAAPRRAPERGPSDDEWQVLDLSLLLATTAGEPTGGILDGDAGWRFAEQLGTLDYDTWAAGHFGIPAPDPGGDTDGDGASEAWEFLTGSDPTRSGDAVRARASVGLPAADLRTLRVAIPRNPLADDRFDLAVDWSPDLAAWQPAVEGIDYRRVPFATDWIIEWEEPADGRRTLFLRLRVTEHP